MAIRRWSPKGLVYNWIEHPMAFPNARTAKNGTYTDESIMFIAVFLHTPHYSLSLNQKQNLKLKQQIHY